MAGIHPFRGLRYDPEVVDLSQVLAPPYDVIDPALQAALYGRAMQNVVRIELGRDLPGDVPGERDRYTRAAGHLGAWRATRAVAVDPRPALYLHAHAFRPPGAGPRERVGVFAAVTPEPWEAGTVLRHEHTMEGPKQDRLRLLEATGVQSSPVFALFEDAAKVASALRRHAVTTPPDAEALLRGENGRERHRLWVLEERGPSAAVVESVLQGLAAVRLLIADGHHRYETALGYAAVHPEANARVLMLLAALDDPGHVILATHRVVPDPPLGADAVLQRLGTRGFGQELVPDVRAALRRMAALRPGTHAFGLVGPGATAVVHRPRRPGPSPARGLDVSVLQEEVISDVLGVGPDQVAAGRLRFTRDPREVVAAAAAGGLGLLLNPTSVTELAAVARAGESMPQKSTYFFPKVPTGLVLLPLR